MSYPYHFLLDLTAEQIALRRASLSQYGLYAQLSALVPIAGFQLYRLARWVLSERKRSAKTEYAAVPGSPTLKKARLAKSGGVRVWGRKLAWWLDGEAWGLGGKRRLWIAGLAWGAWLAFLAVHGTGDDYLHLTKRFGIIAAAQWPLHYMLIMKHRWSPLGLLFSASHEQLNPYHRTLGRVMYGFLLLHACFYLNFFWQMGLLKAKLTSVVPLLGVIAFSLINVLFSTALDPIRKWSYRVFIVTHLTVALGIIPILFFHHHAMRMYIIEALALFSLDILLRRATEIQPRFTKITKIPDTKLLQLTVPMPKNLLKRYQAAPGGHVYLSIPAESRPSTLAPIYEATFNPYTVASVNATSITLVLRALHGPTSAALSHLVKLNKANPPLNIEGPFGHSLHFPDFASDFDRVLLVAGGVGATFIVPIYRQVSKGLEEQNLTANRVSFVWSMRAPAEAAWAVTEEDGPLFERRKNVNIYITGAEDTEAPEDGSVELSDLVRGEGGIKGAETGRVNLKRVVDDVFRLGEEESVAVLVCGPKSISAELREHVGVWVGKGRRVWWHDENFGW